MSDSDTRLHVAELAEAGLAAASLVHELRQPLFAIKALAQIGRQGNGVVGTDLDDLLAAAAHMESLLDAWNDVGRRDSPQIYDLVQVAERVVRMLAMRMEAADVAVRVLCEGPIVVHGSPADARQILLNLLQNALDAVVGRDLRTIDVSFFARDGLHGVRVTDSGGGLTPDQPTTTFEPFYTTKGERGTGLGLHVSQTLCERMGGEIVLHSDGAGTRAEARFVRTAAVP